MDTRGIKKAEVTLEAVLAVALSAIVLFFVLGLFGDNVSTMVQNSRIYQLFNKDNSKKTSWEKYDNDPTKTQMNVQIVADQATLSWYHNQALQQIEKLAAITDPLTDQQTIDLAKFLTIFSQSAPQGVNKTKALTETYVEGTNITYYQLARNNSIVINDIEYRTQFPVHSLNKLKIVKWGTDKDYNEQCYNSSEEACRINNVILIYKAF